jgi:membrane-bound lytic murein transglycosylase B
MKQRLGRVVSSPAFGVVVLTPLLLAGAVAASPGRAGIPISGSDVTPLVTVDEAQPVAQGVAVVALAKPPADFRIAAATGFAPPPPAAVINATGGMRIPGMALSAYRKAEQTMATAAPGCGVSWNLLAGIGRIESSHANGGATDARGTAVRPIYGPTLDGSLPGNEIIVQGNVGGRATYARAMGPMQFLPGTWSRYASDGDGDGRADPQNLFDATLSAARYLCSGGLNLRNQAQVLTAILRYNNSMPYAQNVLGWAAAYATGVAPVDLPAISGPIPALGAVHLENPALLASDPLAQLPLFNLGNNELPGQVIMPGPAAEAANSVLPEHGCQVICMASQLPPAAPALDLPPWMMPPAQMPWLAPPPAPLGATEPGPQSLPGLPGMPPPPAASLPGMPPPPAAPLPGMPPPPAAPLPGMPPAPAAPLPGMPPAPAAPLPGMPPPPAAPWLPPAPGAVAPPEEQPATGALPGPVS